MAFVFYDTETSGLSTRFDQILQIAAICTDSELREVGRFERKCRLMPHIIPSPEALAITGKGIDDCQNPERPSLYEAITELRDQFLEWSPAIFLGWNSMRFDEEMLRQALFQSLYDPYLTNKYFLDTHESNGRGDLLPLARAVALESTSALVVPENNNGDPSFRLVDLATANGFNHSNAHDAVADVEATIHVAKLLRQNTPGQWSNFVRFCQKRATVAFLDSQPLVIYARGSFRDAARHALVPLGQSPDRPNEFLCLDVNSDITALDNAEDDDLVEMLRGENAPVRLLRANQAPILQSWEDIDEFEGRSIDELVEFAESIQDNAALKNRLCRAAACAFHVEHDSLYVEQQIHERFRYSADEEALRSEFHSKPWKDRYDVVRRFTDPRWKRIGYRLLIEHSPDHASDKQLAAYHGFLKQRRIGPEDGTEAPWRTIRKAEAEASAMNVKSEDDLDFLLKSYEGYLEGLRAE